MSSQVLRARTNQACTLLSGADAWQNSIVMVVVAVVDHVVVAVCHGYHPLSCFSSSAHCYAVLVVTLLLLQLIAWLLRPEAGCATQIPHRCIPFSDPAFDGISDTHHVPQHVSRDPKST